MNEHEIRIVRAVGERRLARIERLRWWRVALVVALAGSIAGHAYDNISNRHEIERLRAACVERSR